MNFEPVPGSFRDPAGQVFRDGDRIIRAISRAGVDDWVAVRESGLLDRMAERGWVVASTPIQIPTDEHALSNAAEVVSHPCLPFISHPFEWCFEALKSAALHHLDVHLEALAADITLVDASAYNVQFIGTRPIFIDVLSFRPYQEGSMWAGHRQFCEQFLYPLLIESSTGVRTNAWYRGALEGLTARDVRRLLPLRQHLSPRVWKHVIAPVALAKLARDKKTIETTRQSLEQVMPKSILVRLLRDLRTWISQMQLRDQPTEWGGYSSATSYADDGSAAKRAAVSEFVATVKPGVLWDIGCNRGEFAFAAIEAGADYVVGWDADAGAINQAFIEADKRDARFTPLLTDIANPTPSQGWAQTERSGMAERGPADALMALALVHHLAIARNVPLANIVDWLVGLAPKGLVEFIPKTDPQVQRLLAFRPDIFSNYDRDAFLSAFNARARIERVTPVGDTGREIIWYETE